MKAIIQDRYGSADVLRLEEIDRPVVGDDDVLVRVRAASVNPDIWHVMHGWPYVLRLMGSGLRRPKKQVPGTDMAGHVEVVGRNVTRFNPGDAVFGETLSGHQWTNGGTFAEYVSVPQDLLALKPDNVSFEQAAAVPTSGLIALQNFRDAGQVKPGQQVLINGAAGGVGAIALQLCKAWGAEVTGVDHPTKLDLVRALGADHVLDFTQEDFTQGRQRYHLIFDIPGNHSFSACRRALTPDGTYVLIGHDQFGESGRRILGGVPKALGLMALARFVSQLPKPNMTMLNKKEAMAVLREFLEAGKLTPIIDRTFPLQEAPEAMRYLQTGHAQGRIIITV